MPHPVSGPVPVSPALMKLLAHDLRWQTLEVLAHSDRRVHELVELLGQPFNLVSYHLRKMREAQIVAERRSSADARDVYYTINIAHLRELYFQAAGSLHPALLESVTIPHRASSMGSGLHTLVSPPARVLFLCTYNSARSQMAEAILRREGAGGVEVWSAGSMPSVVHPLASRAMSEMGIDISAQRSKHVDELRDRIFDYVITVCDRVREVCPLFGDDPEQIHWSLPDPAAVEGTDEERYAAFERTAQELTNRIHFLLLMKHSEHHIYKKESKQRRDRTPDVQFSSSKEADATEVEK
ncbi:MAG: ArsR family transcriptional regulator [Chloroflexi bacterium]|nr:ArsR family transcriptional regulator [Chloroflexota bacterium]